jgi:uncharacterized repeat protein (TIGR02543 family)
MHAQWREDTVTPPPTQYTITFDSHGGSAVADITADEGTSVDKPADPTRDGYTFQGWYSAETGGTLYSWPHSLTASVTAHARWNPGASVQITLQPVPGDPSLSDISIFVDEPAEFSTGTGYTSWQWYWNGTLISDENASTYTLAANSKAPGIYDISVVVTTDGDSKLSAQCWLTIKAK